MYEVDDERLELLDALESVPEPGNDRVATEVEPLAGGAILTAFAYVKSRDLATPVHTGYLEDYRDRRFVYPSRRPKPRSRPPTVLGTRLRRVRGSRNAESPVAHKRPDTTRRFPNRTPDRR